MEQSKNPTPAMLINPFPTQHWQMVAQFPMQPATQSMPTPSGDGSSSIHIMMADAIYLAMRAKNYEKKPEGEASTHVDTPSLPQSNGPLTFEKTTFEAPSHPSKGILWCTHNLNMRAAQHYSIIEDLAQAPCAMSALEVLPTEACYTLTLRTVSHASHTLLRSRYPSDVLESRFTEQCWMKVEQLASCHILVGRL
jgi:hypothetical protein